MNKKRVIFIFFSFLLFCIVSLFFFNNVAEKQYGKKEIKTENKEKIEDYNNVSIVDNKLGDPYTITAGYLKNYAIKKSGIWYQSIAQVESIQTSNGITFLILQDINEKESKIKATISSLENVNPKDIVHFVGSIVLDDYSLSLAKISKEEISYQKATSVSFPWLVTNLSLLKKQEFIVHGYLVKKEEKYFLYDSLETYQNNSNSYFSIKWENDSKLEIEDPKQISCQLENSYTLKNCKIK